MQAEWLVLFDIDGTLIQSGGCGRAAARLALEEVFGTTGAIDTITMAGKTDWHILIDALTPAGLTREQIAEGLPIYNEVVPRHLSAIIDGFPVQPCPGARALVERLKAHPDVMLGLVTGNVPGMVPVKLGYAGFNPDDFTVGAFGSEGWERPMLPPLALARAEDRLGRRLPAERVVIVGDTPGDISCALSIRARTLAVATGPYSADELRACEPTYVFETLADVDAVLRAIFTDGAGA